MVVEHCALIFVFDMGQDVVALLRDFISLPEVESLVFEELFAIFFDTHSFCGVGIAAVIIDYFV
jgi:hypothetical protein